MLVYNLYAFRLLSDLFASTLPTLSFLYQTSDKQAVRGAIVGLLVFPEPLQTKCFPVQGPVAFLTQFKRSVAVLHTLIIFPL